MSEGPYAAIIPITDNNVDKLIEVVMASYLGEICPFCKKKYRDIEELKDVVWYPNDTGRVACRACFQKEFPSE